MPESEINVPGSGMPRTNGGGSSDSTAKQVAGKAKDEAANLGSDVGAGAKAVAGEATQQAKVTMAEARSQVQRVASQGRAEVLAQLDGKSQQAAGGLHSLAGQLGALAEGRTEAAGPFGDYARQASDKARQIAQRMEFGGAQGVMDDVISFARRRPGLFLLGSVGAGFLAGRAVRSGKAAMSDDGGSEAARSTTLYATGGYPPAPTNGLPAPDPLFDRPVVSGVDATTLP